ncbi:activating signal cointegrator 1 complex subunit 2 homolog [Vespa velutina]|uniref:activating signal cointegrator 1 complex subunit 2 homolog n=1 Tax=Vespa velutina TaxID=202808 RepID=UPI001FB2067F|nr:activating signal cointegrator 1 complex subunit 2 homolog [Vespa velutina]XP_047357306.1 activating signal cointegrator 1 complex subunit 2 homolog [Vespa velutina]
MKFHIFLITVLPVCLAQFTIQGASDGNRVSQGLRYSEEKGIEYTDQSASLGAGDFTIQGATDGNSDFKIQGATDGHSNFQIQGPSQGAISTFNVQPPTDGHSQSIIQGPYDANQAGTKSLQYNDPSGLRVNWKSYSHDRQPRLQQAQAEPAHYAEPAAQRGPPPPQHRPPPVQPPIQQPSYRPYNDAPAQIKQLLQFQAQIPYVNAIPEQFRYDHLAAAQAQAQQVQAKYQQEAQVPEYRGTKPRGGPSRHRRQAPQYSKQSQGQHPQAQQQPQYRRLSQPPTEPVPQYSTNLPNNLQELLKYQAQIPYNIIANQIRYVPDKPYVPQPIQQSNPQTVQSAQYQGQGDQYQGQASTYSQPQINAYKSYPQEQPGYYDQGQGVRPVTENHY